MPNWVSLAKMCCRYQAIWCSDRYAAQKQYEGLYLFLTQKASCVSDYGQDKTDDVMVQGRKLQQDADGGSVVGAAIVRP